MNRLSLLSYFRSPVALEHHSIALSMSMAAAHARGLTIDLGCGTKPYAPLFEGRVSSYIGIDLDRSGAKAVDICADSLLLPVRSLAADTVVSNQAIEHLRDPATFFREAARILKPGGAFIVTAPQLWRLHEKPHDFYRFTRYALEMLCADHGFEVVDLSERYGAFAAIGQMFSLTIFLRQRERRWRILLAKPVCAAVQLLFHLLDRLFYDPDLTLGYCLVARKKEGD
jgi:SAM-dependent methyltransferase